MFPLISCGDVRPKGVELHGGKVTDRQRPFKLIRLNYVMDRPYRLL